MGPVACEGQGCRGSSGKGRGYGRVRGRVEGARGWVLYLYTNLLRDSPPARQREALCMHRSPGRPLERKALREGCEEGKEGRVEEQEG